MSFSGLPAQHPATATKEGSPGEEQLGQLAAQPQFVALPAGSGQHTAAAAHGRILPCRYALSHSPGFSLEKCASKPLLSFGNLTIPSYTLKFIVIWRTKELQLKEINSAFTKIMIRRNSGVHGYVSPKYLRCQQFMTRTHVQV